MNSVTRKCVKCHSSHVLVKSGELKDRQLAAWYRREMKLSPWFYCRKCAKP